MKNLLLAAALLLASPALHAQAPTVKFSFFGGQKEQKTMKKVYLNDFRVQQVVQSAQSATAGNGAAYAKMTVNFGGVDGAAYQAAVQEVYDEVKARLTTLGYQVLTDEEVKGKREKGCVTVGEIGKPVRNPGLNMTVVNVQPAGRYLCYTESMIPGTFYAKLAKETDAVALSFNYVINPVAFDGSGGIARKKASVEGRPALGLSGIMTAASATGAGAGRLDYAGYPGTEWVRPPGIQESSSNNKPWMGSAMGKYVLDVEQAAYLTAVKKLLREAAFASIDTWLAELK